MLTFSIRATSSQFKKTFNLFCNSKDEYVCNVPSLSSSLDDNFFKVGNLVCIKFNDMPFHHNIFLLFCFFTGISVGITFPKSCNTRPTIICWEICSSFRNCKYKTYLQYTHLITKLFTKISKRQMSLSLLLLFGLFHVIILS